MTESRVLLGIREKPSSLASIADHVATDASHHHPRFHYPSGECEQYGEHLHRPGFIVWRRPE